MEGFALWGILLLVAAEGLWLWAVAPLFWRNCGEHAEEEEPFGRVSSHGEVVLGLLFLLYHWPVAPLLVLAGKVCPRSPLVFWVTITVMILTPAIYASLLLWLTG